MADPRFFAVAGPFRLGELATRIGGRIEGNEERILRDVAALDVAGPDDLSFLDNRKYIESFTRSRAGATIVHPGLAGKAPAGMDLVLSEEPYKAYARAAALFYPQPVPRAVTAPSAVIDPSAKLAEDCTVGANVVIEERVEIGRRCRIGPNTVIGAGVVIGDDVRIGSNVSLSHCYIGSRVLLHPGVRIGQDGFGFAPDPKGHVKVPQLGRVIVEDDVEIGANSTIDRGAGPDTVIGAGTMIDNLVQIGHNVTVGRGCVLVAQVGVSGSTKLGDFVMAGGQAGLAGHLRIGAGAKIAAKSGIMRDIPAGTTYCGYPAVPITEFFRQVAVLQRLAKKKDN
jgi:UDP-3-O-[3-hydroxymyristoyl] glucosamine N-acyltransferase